MDDMIIKKKERKETTEFDGEIIKKDKKKKWMKCL